MPLQQFLSELFEASPNYSLPAALGKLRAFGGISSLLNSLAIDHRQITDIYRHRQQKSFPSTVSLPPPQRIKKSSRRQVQLESILLYLVSLSFFVKVLLYDNGLHSKLNVYSEVISILFIVFILAEKKSRTAGETIERHSDNTEEQKKFRVRRNGYEHCCQAEQLIQGDLVLVEEGDFLRFDAILLQERESAVTVNEEEVGTGRRKCRKHPVWKAEHGLQQDPFLFANSKVVAGKAWVLVCLPVKSSSIKRSNGEVQLGGLLRLSSVSQQVEQVMRVAVVVLVGWLGALWVWNESIDHYDIFLQVVYLIACLTLYLSYANTSEFLSSLKKYLRQKINGKGYRILNHKLLQQLGEIDLVIIEDDCLAEKNFELLTKINHQVDLKIVTPLNQKQLQQRYGDLNHDLIFKSAPSRLLRETLDQLSRAKFISIPYDQFRSYYLEMLRDLRFRMVYMSRSRAAIGRHEEVITFKCSDVEGAIEERVQGEWVRVLQGASAESVLMQLMEKAKGYKRFQSSFYAIVINNCLELAMLFGWAFTGCLLDLNLNLLVVFLNRNRVKQFYEGVALEQKQKAGVGGMWFPVEMNLIFLVYYIYMNWEIAHANNREFQLFLLLMANRMFRIEALLKHPQKKKLVYRLAVKSFIVIVLILMEAGMKYELGSSSDYISESLDTLLLPVILMLYTLFL